MTFKNKAVCFIRSCFATGQSGLAAGGTNSVEQCNALTGYTLESILSCDGVCSKICPLFDKLTVSPKKFGSN